LDELLKSIGYNVLLAEDGYAGLERSAPDALIVDFAMPGMSGADFARAVRANDRTSQSFSRAATLTPRPLPRSPAGTLLRKPFMIDELEAALAHYPGLIR